MDASDRNNLKGKTTKAICIGILFVAAWIRLYNLGGPSLWQDEASTWWFTNLNVVEMVDAIRLVGVHPPMYYIITKLFVSVFSNSEFGLRLTSVLAGIFAVYFAMKIGSTKGGPIGKIIAGVVMAFHPMAIWFSRDARPYALALCFSTATIYLFFKLRMGSNRNYWLLAFFVQALGLLTHYYFFVLSGVLILLALTEVRRRRLFFRSWTQVAMSSYIPLSMWVYWYFKQPTPTLGIGWIQRPVLYDPIFTLWNLVSGYGSVISVASLLFGSVIVTLLVIAWIDGNDKTIARKTILLGVFFPILSIWIISQKRPIYIDRYFLVLLPFVIYLASVGGQWINSKKLKFPFPTDWKLSTRFLFALFCIVSFTAGWQIHGNPHFINEDWRGLVNFYQMNSDSMEKVWFSDPEASVAFEYYLGEKVNVIDGIDLPNCSIPCWLVYRQPYTATHAFSQSIFDPDRPWRNELSVGWRILDSWESGSPLELIRAISE